MSIDNAHAVRSVIHTLGSVLMQDNCIFYSNPKLARQIHPRLDAEGHTWLQYHPIALHQVWQFVAVQPDTMPKPVVKILPVSCIRYDVAGHFVPRFAGHTGPGPP